VKGQSFGRRLGFAFAGLRHTVRREASFRVHLLAAAAVLAVVIVMRPPPVWCALLALAVGAVLVSELVNTALETLLDHLHPEQHPEIGVVKDIAAAAVLVASVMAAAVGIAFVLWYVLG